MSDTRYNGCISLVSRQKDFLSANLTKINLDFFFYFFPDTWRTLLTLPRFAPRMLSVSSRMSLRILWENTWPGILSKITGRHCLKCRYWLYFEDGSMLNMGIRSGFDSGLEATWKLHFLVLYLLCTERFFSLLLRLSLIYMSHLSWSQQTWLDFPSRQKATFELICIALGQNPLWLEWIYCYHNDGHRRRRKRFLTSITLHHRFVLIVFHRFSTSTFRLTSLTSGVTRFSTEAELEQVFISCVCFISLLRVEGWWRFLVIS